MPSWLDPVPDWFTAVFVVLALLAIVIGTLWLTSAEYRKVVRAEISELADRESYTPDGAPEVPPGGCGTVTGMRLRVVPEYTYGRTFETEYGRQAAQAYGVRLAQAAQKYQAASDLASGAAQGRVAEAIAAEAKDLKLAEAVDDNRVAAGKSAESFQGSAFDDIGMLPYY